MLTYGFDDAGDAGLEVLGGKGAGLVEMVRLGLPVPPGFVIGTPCGRDYLASGVLPVGLEGELAGRVAALEEAAGRRFGDDADPLLVSVRSGAPVSMPGMMDTVLNVGLTAHGAELLAERTGNGRFAWTSLERLLDGFARTVRGVDAGELEDALLDLPTEPDPTLAARARCAALAEVIERESGTPFPAPAGQLRESVEAVFRSWRSPRAVAYRRHKGIDEQLGTAVVVQTMVFGNRDEHSGSGVAFTRDPSTGARGVYGDFLFTAQGEDVVSGEHDTDPLPVIGDRLPEVYGQLTDVFGVLERHTRDLCDVEFTIESGQLYVLQTRVGQRSGRAAVALAVDLADEGLITEAEAVGRVTDEQLAAASAPRFTGEPPASTVLARGLAASPGAVTGRAAFDAERAQRLRADGLDVVLLRPTTSPADLPGVIASVGVVTGRGGRTSHAAVVARGMGRAAVCGVGELVVAGDRRSATLAGRTLGEGDLISVDGDRGIVSLGHRDASAATTTDPALARFLGWRRTHQSTHRPATTPTTTVRGRA
ncbi:MAG TPA: pyruvate, phosphate dikinase [Pseudonocardia sp.]|nr:pyruvate, phosphate dikinase [Pseudonocardia sp.]